MANFADQASYRKAFDDGKAPEADFDIQSLRSLPHLESLELQGKLLPTHSWQPEHWRAVASCKQLLWPRKASSSSSSSGGLASSRQSDECLAESQAREVDGSSCWADALCKQQHAGHVKCWCF